MLNIIKNHKTSTNIFSNYTIMKDNEFIGSAILTHDNESVEVFKRHDKNITSKEYEFILNNIKNN